MAQFDRTNLISLLLASMTDADSPVSQALTDKMLYYFEQLLMQLIDTGESGTVTTITETVLTDSGQSWSIDEHNGRTLLITSGSAKGRIYTIDDTTATTITMTGDTLVTDGVAINDTFKILYDFIVNTDGHDHDGVNSAAVVLADDQVTQAKIADSAVGQAQLKKTLGSVSTAVSANVTLPGGLYSLYPQIKRSGGSNIVVNIGHGATNTSYITNIFFSLIGGPTGYAQSYYVTASGEVHWVFILRNKDTKEILSVWQAPDHPCLGNSDDPTIVEHPFPNFDTATGVFTSAPDPETGDVLICNAEIIVVNPTYSEVKKLREASKQERLDVLEILIRDFDFKKVADTEWPDFDVTIGLDEDLDTGKFSVVKGKVPKPTYVKCHKLKKKGG